MTSRPVWAILVANAAGNYGAYMLLTQMPTYLKEVLKFDIKSVGFFFLVVLCTRIKIAIYNNGLRLSMSAYFVEWRVFHDTLPGFLDDDQFGWTAC